MADLAGLQPEPSDPRTVALAKAAILSLVTNGERVTQGSIVARSRSLPQPARSARSGIGRATLTTNEEVAALYREWRSLQRRERGWTAGGRTPADARLTISLLAHKLAASRAATAMIERQLDLACRAAKVSCSTLLIALRDRRSKLWANRHTGRPRQIAKHRHEASERQLQRVVAFVRRRAPRPTPQSAIADEFGMPTATAARYLQKARAVIACGDQSPPDPALLRLRKQDLIRALEVERRYQRELKRERDQLALARLKKVQAAGLRAMDPALVWPLQRGSDLPTDSLSPHNSARAQTNGQVQPRR